MEGPKNRKYNEIKFELRKKEKLKEVFYDHDDDTVYVDSHRNISVALGEVTDLSKELKEKGFEEKDCCDLLSCYFTGIVDNRSWRSVWSP